MKRNLWIVWIILVMSMLACNLGTRSTSPTVPQESTMPAAIDTPTEGAAATVAPQPSATPPAKDTPQATATQPEAILISPTAEDAQPDATDTPTGPVEYVETFDRANDYWSDPLIVTTQAQGRDAFVKVSRQNGTMRFAIEDKETYVYSFFRYTVDGDGSITAEYQPRGSIANGIALVCKSDADLTKWYEVRLKPDSYSYSFYVYDKALRVEQKKNPYKLLGDGHLALKEFSAGQPNTFALTCTDSDLTLNVNNGKKVATIQIDEALAGNVVGVGVMSYDVLPATIDFEQVTIRQEQ